VAEFSFVVQATISLGIQVEADTLAEAIEKAKEANVGTIHRESDRPDEWHTSGEIDCAPPGDCWLVDAHRCDFQEAEKLWKGEADG
jgi:hypothetical protein